MKQRATLPRTNTGLVASRRNGAIARSVAFNLRAVDGGSRLLVLMDLIGNRHVPRSINFSILANPLVEGRA